VNGSRRGNPRKYHGAKKIHNPRGKGHLVGNHPLPWEVICIEEKKRKKLDKRKRGGSSKEKNITGGKRVAFQVLTLNGTETKRKVKEKKKWTIYTKSLRGGPRYTAKKKFWRGQKRRLGGLQERVISKLQEKKRSWGRKKRAKKRIPPGAKSKKVPIPLWLTNLPTKKRRTDDS